MKSLIYRKYQQRDAIVVGKEFLHYDYRFYDYLFVFCITIICIIYLTYFSVSSVL